MLQDQGDKKLCEVMNIERPGSEGHISMSVTHSVEQKTAIKVLKPME